jgi:hypothetical protein
MEPLNDLGIGSPAERVGGAGHTPRFGRNTVVTKDSLVGTIVQPSLARNPRRPRAQKGVETMAISQDERARNHEEELIRLEARKEIKRKQTPRFFIIMILWTAALNRLGTSRTAATSPLITLGEGSEGSTF